MLMAASMGGLTSVVEQVLPHSTIDETVVSSHPSEGGYSALMYSSMHGHTEVVKMLQLHAGAEPLVFCLRARHTVYQPWLTGGGGGRPGTEAASRTPSAPSALRCGADRCAAHGGVVCNERRTTQAHPQPAVSDQPQELPEDFEAELMSVVKGTCETMGRRSIMGDLGLET